MRDLSLHSARLYAANIAQPAVTQPGMMPLEGTQTAVIMCQAQKRKAGHCFLLLIFRGQKIIKCYPPQKVHQYHLALRLFVGPTKRNQPACAQLRQLLDVVLQHSSRCDRQASGSYCSDNYAERPDYRPGFTAGLPCQHASARPLQVWVPAGVEHLLVVTL